MRLSLAYPIVVVTLLAVWPVHAEPLFNPTHYGENGGHFGYFNSPKLEVGYKGFLQRNYTVSRDQSGLLISWEYHKDDETEVKAGESDANENKDDKKEQDNNKKKKTDKKIKDDSIALFYIHAPMNDSARFEGSGPLSNRRLSGQNWTLGGMLGAGRAGDGVYLFAEVEFVDENVSFVANNRNFHGSLEGSDYTVGFGVSKALGKYFTLAGTASVITASDYDFRRSAVGLDSTVDIPTTETNLEKVKRTDRRNFGLMATFNLSKKTHINVVALNGSEKSMTVVLNFSF